MSEEIKVYIQGNPDARYQCLLMHGFGADANDLMGLSSEINTKTDIQFLFPQAPYTIQIADSVYGTAWFPRTEDEVMQAFTGDYFTDLAEKNPQGLADSVDEMLEYCEKQKLDWTKLIIGGFSQGGMVAAELALRAPKPPAALLLMSSSLVARERWSKLMDDAIARWGQGVCVPLFQSHGTMDPVLSVDGGEAMYEFLSSGPFEGELYSFYGGHEIPRDTLDEVVEFIDGLATRSAE